MEILNLYRSGMSIAQVAKEVGWSYDKTRYRLIKQGAAFRGAREAALGRAFVFSDQTRRRMSEGRKRFFSEGGKHWNQGGKMSPESRLRLMQSRCRYSIDLAPYKADVDKLHFLMGYLRRSKQEMLAHGTSPEMFLERFFPDPQFCRIFEIWSAYPSKNTTYSYFKKLWRPTLDHLVPRTRKGTWHLDNLQFITWRENRDKCDMTQQEWDSYRLRHSMHCELYAANLMTAF